MEEIVGEAQRILFDAQVEIFRVRPGECMLCYSARNLTEFGCNGTHRFVLSYRDQVAGRATAVVRRLTRMGACCCDCEVFMNAYVLDDRYVIGGYWQEGQGGVERFVEFRAPDPLPNCEGVRKGSTQACGAWRRRR